MQQTQQPPKQECSAFCPQCKSDLYYLDGICYCKNKDCAYSCDKCKKQREALVFDEKSTTP